MELIKPSEISGKIMTLIEETEKELTIITPYNGVAEWKKLQNRIRSATERGVKIKWYSRANGVDKKNSQQVSDLGITPILIENLHAKLYMNDSRAILTSMNLVKASDDNSLDIGVITTTDEEFQEIVNFYQKYIQPYNKSEHKYTKTTNVKERTNIHAEQSISNKPVPGFMFEKVYLQRIHNFLFTRKCSFSKMNFEKNDSEVVIENLIYPLVDLVIQEYSNANSIKLYFYFDFEGDICNR